MTLAVIKTGGKQYIVSHGQKINVEKLEGEVGQNVIFDALLVSDDKGDSIEIGKPILEKKVEGKILKQFRARKIRIVKFKRKVRYKKTQGHRQHYTQVEITKI